MATSSEWLAALAADPAPPPAPRWFEALGSGTAGFRAGAPFATALMAPAPMPAPAPAPAPATAPATESDLAAADPRDEAVARAFAAGEAAGRAAARAEAEAEIAHARALRLNFRALDEAAHRVLADELAATVMALCEQVLGDYAVDPAALAARCEAAAQRFGSGWQGAVLHLHPDDLAGLADGALAGWQIAADPALARGQLLIAGPDSAVRDGPEDWARALAEALRP